jgi:ABC-2 type transport system permease protein
MLLVGIVLFEYFAEATSTAVASVVDRETFVRKVHFPRMAIPLSVTLTAALNLLLNFVAVFLFVAIAGVQMRWSWLELPLLLIALVVFATGVAMLLSALYVRFRDLKPIWEIFMRALFYATPVLYPIEQLSRHSELLAHIVVCNPVAAIIVQVRHAVVDPSAPSAAAAIGSSARLLIPAGILVGVSLLGLWVFNRMAPRIAEEL